jgi:hypothetical protein
MEVSPSSASLLWPPYGDNGYVSLWRRNYNLNYWYQYLPTTQTMYLAYNRCAQMPDLSFAAFLNQVIAYSQPVSHIVVDLRNNLGGDSQVFQPLLDALSANASLRRKLVAIIGQATFSSGVMNAISLAAQFGIPLIGQPTGGTPSSYGNIVYITLPNSGLSVSCSTMYFRYSNYTGNSLLPDVPVSMSSADYFGRSDPFLTAALVQPVQFHTPQPGTSALNVVNTASLGTPISPGEWASVLGNFSGIAPEAAASLPYPTSLGGVQVQVNGVAAPLLAVSPSQIVFQVPSATAVGSAQIAVGVPGQDVAAGTVPVVGSSPGIFVTNLVSLNRPGAVLTYPSCEPIFRIVS